MPSILLRRYSHLAGAGLFNAINGLGAAGRVDPTTSSNSNTALYSTFGIAAFFAGLDLPLVLEFSRLIEQV